MVIDQTFKANAWLGGKKTRFGKHSTYEGRP
jgi:hypothetical protein